MHLVVSSSEANLQHPTSDTRQPGRLQPVRCLLDAGSGVACGTVPPGLWHLNGPLHRLNDGHVHLTCQVREPPSSPGMKRTATSKEDVLDQ